MSLICLLEKNKSDYLKSNCLFTFSCQTINMANDLCVLASETTNIVQTQLFSYAHNNKESLQVTRF